MKLRVRLVIALALPVQLKPETSGGVTSGSASTICKTAVVSPPRTAPPDGLSSTT